MASIWRTTHPASWSQKNLLHLEICDSSPSARGGHSTCLVCSLACLSTDPELAAVTPDFAIEFDDDACPAQQCYSGLIGPCRFSRSNRKHNRPLIAPVPAAIQPPATATRPSPAGSRPSQMKDNPQQDSAHRSGSSASPVMAVPALAMGPVASGSSDARGKIVSSNTR